MNASRRPLLVSAALALALGPRLAFAWGNTVTGSGTAASEHRDVGSFTAIALGGPFEVILRTANREAIDIRADDNVLPLIETRIRTSAGRRSLEIELRNETRVAPRTPIVITVDIVLLEGIAISGSGRIAGNALRLGAMKASIGGSGTFQLGDLEASEITVAIGGSGLFQADGRVRKLAVKIAGNGKCDAARLVAADVAVSIAGSGDAYVHADATLQASIAGSGDVIHSGNATPKVSIAGSGRVMRG